MRRKPRRLNKPYPAVADIPDAGLTLYEAKNAEESYRIARGGGIATIDVGPRRKKALMHVTCRQLGVDPNRD